MKTIKGQDITATEAAKQLVASFGDSCGAMCINELCQELDLFKITDKQEVKLREQIKKMQQRVHKCLRV